MTTGIAAATVTGDENRSDATLEDRLRQPFWPSTTPYRTALAVTVIVGIALRLYRLTDLFPVLVDEAIYLRWAEIIHHDHIWFISLLDAKPPLAYWMYATVRLVFTENPLLGSRLVPVAAGTLAAIAVYRVGFLCAGERAGIVTALLYSLLPYGVLYDRIAYVDSLTNLFGALLVAATMSGFGALKLSWKRSAIVGVTLGLALFTKTTVLLLAFVPAAIAFHVRRGSRRRGLMVHLSTAYGVAAIFPVITYFAMPAAPAPEVNNLLFHRSTFFTPLWKLASDPFLNLRFNGPLIAVNLSHYVTYTVLAAVVGAVIVLCSVRQYVTIVILASCVVPFIIPLAVLEYFPSRYAFPHTWPLLLAIGCASGVRFATVWARSASRLVLAIVILALAIRSEHFLLQPESVLTPMDGAEFLGSGPYAGFGVLEAIGFLRTEARRGPAVTILTDPLWGPPADVVFAYLNKGDATRVYEAWWLELKDKYPLVPTGNMPVWKSHYQRIHGEDVDFSSLSPVYYITDTNYHTPADVEEHNPRARLIRRFPKRGGMFIDVYRVN